MDMSIFYIVFISQIFVFIHNVTCNLVPDKSFPNVEHFREKRKPGGPGGVRCGPGELVKRCKYDVDDNQYYRWLTLGENRPSFEVSIFNYDITKSQASNNCPQGTRLAVINDAWILDEAVASVFESFDRDTKYWVDVNVELDNIDFFLERTACTCVSTEFALNGEESTVMEVKRDEYQIKKKRSTDKRMMRGVICQKEEGTTAKPTQSTKHTSTSSNPSSSSSFSMTPTMNQSVSLPVMNPTAEPTSSFDWIIFLLSIIAVTLLLGLFLGCVICCRIKSHQKNVNQSVVCAVEPSSKECVVSVIPTAPPAYESNDYQGLMRNPKVDNVHTNPDKSFPQEGTYIYETPMETPRLFQQPAGIYNGSSGYMDIDGPTYNNHQSTDEFVYDELDTNTTPPEYSYAYADRKSIADELQNKVYP
ncbi:uncharacterized protein [Antedon mediterranea]|uniref:uncharacterized protein isoform X1 n=1 Tax=Antedon mediterranea TaxID=105859 RepID=UPI003AF543B6